MIHLMTTDRIEINSRVMMGKPVIKGTRITVELVLRKLGEGATEADLLDAYPRLTSADIRAAITYAADTVAHEEIILLSATSSKFQSVSDALCRRRRLRLRGSASSPLGGT